MNDDLDPLVQSVLAQARAAVEPEPRQLARALGGVLERVAAPEIAESGGRADAPSSAAWRPQLPAAAKAPGRASLLHQPLAFWSWGALTATVGFVLGMQYERRVAPSPAAVTAPMAAPAPPAVAAAAPPANPAPAAAPLDRGADASATSAPEREATSKLARESRRTPPPAPRDARATSAGKLDFRAVLDRVRRAERAERQGEPGLAIALLDELDEQAEASTLRDERLLTRVLALCALDDIDRAKRVARELETRGESIYTARLKKSCIKATDAPAGDPLRKPTAP